jgi:hypothetical protein
MRDLIFDLKEGSTQKDKGNEFEFVWRVLFIDI